MGGETPQLRVAATTESACVPPPQHTVPFLGPTIEACLFRMVRDAASAAHLLHRLALSAWGGGSDPAAGDAPAEAQLLH